MAQIETIDGLPGLNFDTSYARLPEHFFAKIHARDAKAPKLAKLNIELAKRLGLDTAAIDPDKAARILSGNGLPGDGTLLAMAYSGHQFGQFNPTLGDGRAGLVGEVIDRDGKRRDIQLKGSGPTPFSRSGDGLAALGPVMREYIVSEAMAALDVPTTRSLAIVLTGDVVFRERLLPGAVLARVADSHLRIGTFQYFAARGDKAAIAALVEYAIERHYPDLTGADNAPLALLERVIDRQASLVAQWMGLGFIHGVMNTDNMTISGETIDYGPCAFMDHYEHGKVFSSIDQHGRYAYGAQPHIAQWNLARLAETLIPLIDTNEDAAVEKATAAVQAFSEKFAENWHRVLGAKFGFGDQADPEANKDMEAGIIRGFLTLMQKHHADFTNAFVALTKAVKTEFQSPELETMFNADPELRTWTKDWRAALRDRKANALHQGMQISQPGLHSAQSPGRGSDPGR